ncbi:hemerythrin domain-containing protein [Chitinimonas koreensis]|uniref:hemerythrin domain-containing protein n=1 Tax=Chitinimonas koreensis TaxID=356302 RepID=UPI00041D1492|nr:hemerythrin domain-containing protein [Chitinimonas koreensis]QNM95142.1 hemerythrin domain-containing protein [Chitinimonas koreensis]
MTDAIARLIHEHHTCDDLLERVEAAARRADWPAARDHFHEAEQAMLGHFELEEERLFPAFEQATGIVHGPTAVMREEHEAMRDLLENCRSILLLEDAAALQAELDTLFILVQQHNVKEENVLYPLCRARVPGLAALLAEPAPAQPA